MKEQKKEKAKKQYEWLGDRSIYCRSLPSVRFHRVLFELYLFHSLFIIFRLYFLSYFFFFVVEDLL